MTLSFAVRRVDNVSIVRCIGRVVGGAESEPFFRMVSELLPHTRLVVLQMDSVDFIDSGGLGLLVRIARRIQTSGGRIVLCAPSPRVAASLRATRLDSIFEIHDLEDDAVASLHRSAGAERGSIEFVNASVLCAVGSADILSYVSELISQTGYGVLTADSVPDAVTLLRVAQPKLVITTQEFRRVPNPEFTSLLAAASVLELSPEFSRADAGASAGALLAAVRNAIGPPVHHASDAR